MSFANEGTLHKPFGAHVSEHAYEQEIAPAGEDLPGSQDVHESAATGLNVPAPHNSHP